MGDPVIYGIKYWQQGDFQNLMGMHQMMQMQDKSMMGGSMMNDGNMQNMKKQ